MNADGTGEPQRLTNDGKVDLSPSWSPNGERIAFQKQVGTVPGARFQIWSMKADGTDPTQLTSSAGTNLSPDWGELEIPGRDPRQ